MHSFGSFNWVFPAFLIVAPITVATLTLLWIIRKSVPKEIIRKHHDVAGYLFSIIGILYSVILGYTVINDSTKRKRRSIQKRRL